MIGVDARLRLHEVPSRTGITGLQAAVALGTDGDLGGGSEVFAAE
jgi:hypothetical protein